MNATHVLNPGFVPSLSTGSGVSCDPSVCNGAAIFPTPRGGNAGQQIFGRDRTAIEIDIRLKQNPNVIDAFSFLAQVNPSHLQFVSASAGDLTTNFIAVNGQENPAVPGMISCGGFGTTPIPVNSAGVLIRLRFNVLCASGERSEIRLSDLRDGIAGFSACCNIFSCVSCLSDGDINGDSALTPGDALCAFEIFLQGGQVSPGCDLPNFECELTAADVNCDGSVTPGDALAIFQRFLLRLPPADCFARTAGRVAEQDHEIAVEPGMVSSSPRLLRLGLKATNPLGVSSFGLKLGYPAHRLQFLGVERGGLTASWLQLEGRMQNSGEVLLGGYHLEPIAVTKPDVVMYALFAILAEPTTTDEFVVLESFDDLRGARVRAATQAPSLKTVMPSAFKIHQSFPNPFGSPISGERTMIRFELPGNEVIKVELIIYNVAGQLVRELISGEKAPGKHEITWNGKDEQGREVPSGIYLYRLTAGRWKETKRIVVMR
ncbi:MAG: FlgD immunoglobulin-like domain containing protein [bacterium]